MLACSGLFTLGSYVWYNLSFYQAQGRYLFLIENEVIEVPEPPTTELLLMGLFGAAVMLRHRRRGEPARQRSQRRRDWP